MEAVIDSNQWKLSMGDNYVQLSENPMLLEFFSKGQKVAVFNGRQTLKFEHLRKKPDV